MFLTVFLVLLNIISSEKAGLNGNSKPDLCDAGVMFYDLSYQTNWELVVMCVDDNPEGDG